MLTILGAGGQIANELAVYINENYTDEVRLVSRNPRKVNASDQPFPANLLVTTSGRTGRDSES